MTTTPNLGIAFIDSGVPQPEVTHNDAIRSLDALVQLIVQDRDLATPPGSPSDGQRWIVAASPTGARSGHTNHVLAWQDGAWRSYVPKVGWLAYVVDEGMLLAWSGSAWVDAMSMLTTLQNLLLLGVGTTADSTNPLSAKLNNTLWVAKTVAEGGDGNLRYKLSKESASKSLSLLMQTNFSGRAELGLTGDDDFHFKVSPDGSTWAEALTIGRSTGGIRFLAAETDVASAATCDIGAAANLKVQITGTTTITSFGTVAHAIRFLRFAGALPLTHNATSLILPGGANIATAAGDTCVALSDASGNWRVFAYQRASGKAVAGGASTDISDATTVGRAVLVATDAPTAREALYAAPFDALSHNNLAINGGMEVSQDIGSSTVALTSGTETYIVDQWTAKFVRSATLACSGQQTTWATPPGGLQFNLQLKATTGLSTLAAGDYAYLATPIEGYRVSRLGFGLSGTRYVTLGFWVYATIAGTMAVAFQNSAGNRTYVVNVTINNAATTEYKTVTIPVDTSGTWLTTTGIGLKVIFCFGSGATNQGTPNQWNADGKFATSSTTNFMATTNNIAVIGGVTIVPTIGTIELPTSENAHRFLKPFSYELGECLRYYEKSYDYADAPGTATTSAAQWCGYFHGLSSIDASGSTVIFKTPKRVSPTVTFYSPMTGTSGKLRDAANSADVTANIQRQGINSVAVFGSFTSGSVAQLEFHWKADARM